ncbi:MAG: tRNA lysidine(34) synthetase TilS [Alphaproteobacteria bacterium]|nr:tRNA lysidine(34) synthetase TilS [Alphaproteobacteria bacterium]
MAPETAAPISEREFSDLMEPLGPFEPKPQLAVAYSGGADSTAMVLMAARWAKRRGGDVVAVTVDHGLRPDSAAEAQLAQSRIRELGVGGVVLCWKSHKPTSGIQKAARDARYGLMSGWCRRKGILHLLLAHHQEDQAETMLHRLGRQTGADGLAGMARIRETADIRLLRPCLHVARNRLQAVVEERGLKWVEDPSNHDPAYARVRLRKLLPALEVEQISPTALGGTARRLAQVRQTMENQTASILAASAEINSLGCARIDFTSFIEAEREIARRILERLLGSVGGNLYPVRHQLLDNLLNDIRQSGLLKARTLAGCRILRIKNNILIVREAARCPVEKVTPGVWIDWDNRFRLKVSSIGKSKRSDIYIRALGDDFPQKLSKKTTKTGPKALNVAVRRALPSVWDRYGLLSVPHLGYGRTPRNPASVARMQVEYLPNRPVTNAFFPVV